MNYDITQYLRGRSAYLRLPGAIGLMLVNAGILYLLLSVIALTTVSGGMAAVGDIGSAMFVFLLALFWLALLAATIVTVAVLQCYWRAFAEFNVGFLIPGAAVACFLTWGSGTMTVAAIMGLHLVAALYIVLGRWLIGRVPPAATLRKAPRSNAAALLSRYRWWGRTAWKPWLTFLLDMAKFNLVIVLAVAILSIFPVYMAARAMSESMLGGEPASIGGSGSFLNPNFFIWIAYLIWLRPFLGHMFVSSRRRFWRNVALSAAQVLSRDRRHGILFLRSFADDELRVQRRRSAVEWLLGVPRKAPIRLEEALADIAFRFGPVASLSNPNRKAQDHLGAARDVLPKDNWQQEVIEKFHLVQDVLFVLGSGQGLRWEMETLDRLDLLNKLIVIVPPSVSRIAGGLETHLLPGLKLPEYTGMPLVLFALGDTIHVVTSKVADRRAYEEASLLAFQLRRRS